MWEENSTTALMIDGKIVACVSEERFSRTKNDERYPKNAIEYVLKAGGVKPNEIDLVAFTGTIWRPHYILTRRYSNSTVEDYLKEQKEYWYPRLYKHKNIRYFDVFKNKLDLNQYPQQWTQVLKFIKKDEEVRSENKASKFFQEFRAGVVGKHLGISAKKVIFVDHHTAHAYYAYYASPIRDNALIFTADAWGDNINASVSTVKKGKIKRIYAYDKFILGRLYRYITLILGMKPNEHEYKMMGLAPYAKEKYYQKALKVFEKTQFVKGIGFDYKTKPADLYFYFKERLDGQRFDNITGAIQKYTENLLSGWVKNAIKKTGLNRICLAGGTAMNVKAIMEINKLPEVKEVFVPPSPGDESEAIGSAYVAMAGYCRQKRLNPDKILKPLKDAYLGPDITAAEIENLIKKEKLDKKYKVVRKVKPGYVAKLLAAGLVIGRAAGRSEFGARALGNRSILADPRDPGIIKVINQKIKNRDFWMPFAATVLEKRAKDYFLNYKKIGAPYMTIAFETTPLAARHLKAGLHPSDLTCRPQVLKRSQNLAYEKIISAFEKITGVGGLLNTSFNLHGEPIVQTAADAYRVFKLSDIDSLLLNSTLIQKVDATHKK